MPSDVRTVQPMFHINQCFGVFNNESWRGARTNPTVLPPGKDYFDRIGLFSKSFTQSIWLSFGAMRWLLLVAIGLGAGLESWLNVNALVGSTCAISWGSNWSRGRLLGLMVH